MAPTVFQRNKTLLSSSPHSNQNGNDVGAARSDDVSPSNSMSDAENFECYGEAHGDPNRNTDIGNRSPSHINRHTWMRTSLRRTPPSHQENLPNRRWGSMRHSGKRQLGSNVLASQLYRSSSFNSSGCGSGGEPADDMYSDVSLEEDVQGLNYKVQLLQQQVTSLADTQNTADDRYARVKAENAVLQARVHMLDEQIREIECRCEERIAEEQRRCREAIARIERDRDQQLTAMNERLSTAEADASQLKQEVGRLKGVAEGLRMGAETEARRFKEAQEQLSDVSAQLQQAKETYRKERDMSSTSAALVSALRAEVERLQATTREPAPALLHDPCLDDLHTELALLRTQNKSLSEAQEELQAQILTRGIEEGRTLLDNALSGNSLAQELGQMTNDELDGCHTQNDETIELEKIQKALKEQQDVNVQLRTYIDGILLSIVENYPQLLEVKYQKKDEITAAS